MRFCTAAGAACLVIFAASGAAAQDVRLTLGHAVFEAHPFHDAAVRFRDAVSELSDGSIEIVVRPARQLGDVNELMDGVQLGTVDMTINSSSAVASLVPSIDAFQLPGVIQGYEGFAAAATSDEARQILDELEPHGMLALGLYDGGQRHFLTVGDPVQSIEDFRGLRTRVAPERLFLDIWQAVGANPTPMAYGEVYYALETGTLDAVEINLTSIESESFYEVGGGVTLTGHYFWPGVLLMNQARFEDLSEEHQQILRDAAAQVVEPQVMAISELDDAVIEKLGELGIPVIEPDEAFLQQFQESVEPVVQRYRDSSELIDAFVEAQSGNR
jgi:TRAP-type transport system periplasmic protein